MTENSAVLENYMSKSKQKEEKNIESKKKLWEIHRGSSEKEKRIFLTKVLYLSIIISI